MTAGCQSEVEERRFNFVECIQRVIRSPPDTGLSGERVHVSRYARACIPAMATRDAPPSLLPNRIRTRFAFSKTFSSCWKKETHHATRASFPKNRDKLGGGAVKICWIFRPFRGECPEFIGEAIYFHIFRRSMAHRSDSKGTSPFAKREFPILHRPFSINLRNLSLS